MGHDLGAALKFWFGDFRPPSWGEIQGRLIAYGSDSVVAAYKECVNADNEAHFKFSVWKSAYDHAKANESLDSTSDDPSYEKASNRMHEANDIANEKDQTLIDLIRNELQSRPSAS
jgi:hypothetical protein